MNSYTKEIRKQIFAVKLLNSLLLISIVHICCSFMWAQQFWRLDNNGTISWNVDGKVPHYDHMEMSGKLVSVVLRYGVGKDGSFKLNKSMIWPMLRTIPNDTYASLMRRYNWNLLDALTINGRELSNENVIQLSINGYLGVESLFKGNGYTIFWDRKYFPSVDQPALMEMYKIINKGDNAVVVEIPEITQLVYTDSTKGVYGSYCIEARSLKSGTFTLLPNDSVEFSSSILAYKKGKKTIVLDAVKEEAKRCRFVECLSQNLVLKTPDPVIDRMFAFSKVRVCESIYETAGGPMHGPGGESYYAAIWANDQAEYVNAFFPFVGYDYGNLSALNSFKHFARFMNDEWKPIPSSIIAEGLDIWNGAGDRGDAAMIAYGASRYALARANREEAETLWPLITWCLEYCKHNLNSEGVVTSNSDELEGRFPAGDANLCTSSLYYDALISASYLAKELGKSTKVVKDYRDRADVLRANINCYFGANVEGFETYAYYKGNDVLRSWICIPLTMGIDERAKGTIEALFSPRLWTENGLLTQAGTSTFWDRSTLYALRGAYSIGETDRATEYLHKYSATRLLGNHVPYAIEAWPEGEQRHLSAESGLYARIITEGLFGIRPTGFKSFKMTPRLPSGWNEMALKHIYAFGDDFDISVERVSSLKLEVKVKSQKYMKKYMIISGESIGVNLK